MKIGSILKLIRHAFQRFPLIYAALALSILSVVVELAAMASLFPLAELAAGRSIRPDSKWNALGELVFDNLNVRGFLVLFLGLLLARVITAGLVALLNAYIFRNLIAHFCALAFETFVKHLSFKEIHEYSIGHYITLAGDEANRASQIVTAILKLASTGLLAALYLAALAYHSIWVGFAVLIFLGTSGAGLLGAFQRSHELGVRQQEESRTLGTFFIDSLSSLRTVRAFNAENYVASRWAEMLRRYARTCFSVDAINILARVLPAALLVVVGMLLMGYWITLDTLSRYLAFGFAATIMLLRLLPLVGQALDIFMRLTADLKAGQNVATVVDAIDQAGSREPEPEGEPLSPARRIEFRNVTFGYIDCVPILSNFCAVFEAGKSYAIVGASGVGKSTLIDLLLAFYKPWSGQITVNGISAEDLIPQALRARMTIVEQHARLFNDTVRNNLSFGRLVSTKELATAVGAACLDDVLAALPNGYDTLLSFQGSNFSGGQRQRINIARALVKLADVLILDESTAGLDPDTRDRVVVNLKNIYRDRILIFLTHDKDLISYVDEVVTLEKPKALHADSSYQPITEMKD